MVIKGITFNNIPNKKLGTQITTPITQSNVGNLNDEDYINSQGYYKLFSLIDIDWNGAVFDQNIVINDTSDCIQIIKSLLSTVNQLKEKVTDLETELNKYKNLFYLGSTEPTVSNFKSLETIKIGEWTQQDPYILDMTSLSGPTSMFLMIPEDININNIRILDSQNNSLGISFNKDLEIQSTIKYKVYDILLGQGTYRFFIQ